MSGLVVIKTQVIRPLEVYRRNRAKYEQFRARYRSFASTFGWVPYVIEHPEGSISVGVEPRSHEDLTDPPHGWFVDTERGMLNPDRTTDRGSLMWSLLESICWEPERVPDVQPEDTPHILHHLPVLQPGDMGPDGELSRPAMIEVAEALWAVVPTNWADWAVQTGTWVRARKAHLMSALSQAGWTNTPASAVGA